MKVRHVVVRAIQDPQPEKVYGARVVDLTLSNGHVTVGWAIFGRKTRTKKAKPDAKR